MSFHEGPRKKYYIVWHNLWWSNYDYCHVKVPKGYLFRYTLKANVLCCDMASLFGIKVYTSDRAKALILHKLGVDPCERAQRKPKENFSLQNIQCTCFKANCLKHSSNFIVWYPGFTFMLTASNLPWCWLFHTQTNAANRLNDSLYRWTTNSTIALYCKDVSNL